MRHATEHKSSIGPPHDRQRSKITDMEIMILARLTDRDRHKDDRIISLYMYMLMHIHLYGGFYFSV